MGGNSLANVKPEGNEIYCFVLFSLVVCADLFSTQCAPNGLFYFDLVSGDLPWRLFRMSIKKKTREVKSQEEV